MTDAARIAMRPPELDEPARRLLWIIPAAIAVWAILLSGFSLILMRTTAPREELTPIEARLVEIPREVGGLQGGGGAIHPAAPAIPHPKSEPIVKPHPATHVKKTAPMAPVIRSEYGTEKPTNAPGVEEAPGAGAAGESGGSETGGGSGGGIGSDTVGARAAYAPTPVIPDDLREDAIQTEAVARFKVSFDGASEVTLEKPTSSPRLNQVILDTLKQWKFFPAVHNGVAIESSFEVRIPISVQ
ncbi:energy transducer TonB [Candidatus Binatus soli]|jgi:protein TonB|uniref:energy transducer TonB n=1 Tax=Candidatus Binatus soli TaxID=1953413 RepID=UPI003D09E122